MDIDNFIPLKDSATSTGATANLIFSNSYDQKWKPSPHEKNLEIQNRIAEVLVMIPKKEYPLLTHEADFSK